MKIIKYKLLSAEINHGTEQEPKIEQIFTDTIIRCSEEYLASNEEIAKKEAYNGEYEIYDDGQPDLINEPTEAEKLDARLTYLEMMTGFLEV